MYSKIQIERTKKRDYSIRKREKIITRISRTLTRYPSLVYHTSERRRTTKKKSVRYNSSVKSR